jgi:hypothetical protein
MDKYLVDHAALPKTCDRGLLYDRHRVNQHLTLTVTLNTLKICDGAMHLQIGIGK